IGIKKRSWSLRTKNKLLPHSRIVHCKDPIQHTVHVVSQPLGFFPTKPALSSPLSVPFLSSHFTPSTTSSPFPLTLNSPSRDMAKESTDWPPPEWRTKVEVKNGRKIKYYVNKRSGLKCYSKPALLRILEAENSKIKALQLASEHSKSTSGRLDNQDEPRWLPSGWRLEWKVRKSGRAMGSKYRCYVELSTGMKFYSEPEVSRYLMAKQKNTISAEPNEEDISNHSSSKGQRHLKSYSDHKSALVPKLTRREAMHNGRKVIIETTIDEDLPPGWLKETWIKRSRDKLRKDTFYVNPMGDYIFISKLDAFRYLETGQPPKNAKKRKIDSINKDTNGCKIMGEGCVPSNIDSKLGLEPRRARCEEVRDGNKGQGHVTSIINKKAALEPKLTQREEIHNGNKVVIETTIDEELPPGWLKEIRIKKLGGRLRKDMLQYYVNPMVNYIFKSKVEFLRYLDTGGATKNARTRKNDGINEEMNGCKIMVPSSKKTRITTADAVNKSLFEEPEDLENGQSKQPSDLLGDESAAAKLQSQPAVLVEGRSLDSVIEEVTVDTKPISKTKSRMHKQDKKAIKVPNRSSGHRLAGVEAQPVLSTLPIEHAIRATRRATQKESVTGTDLVPNDLTVEKPEKEDKKATNVPSRTSRRLAGVKAQPVVSSLSIEHTIRATRRASQKAKSVSSTIPVPNDSTAEKLDIDIPKEPAAPDPTALRLPSDTVPKEASSKRVKTHKNFGDKKSVGKTEKNIQEPVSLLVEPVQDPPVAAQTPASIETNGNDNGPFYCTAIWSDPCLEFAYKTLTGAIPLDPLDDNLAIQDYVDHQLRTFTQTNGDANASNITKLNSPSNGEH
ncbi:Methyl-CpG-binding domain-containing protein, partial [Drosera capensis]